MLLSRRVLAPCLALIAFAGAALAQQAAGYDDVADTRRALADARGQADSARIRAEKLEAVAVGAAAAADRTAAQAAAIAARIQQAQADIAADEANIHLIERQRIQLRAGLAERQRPLLRLTAALQRLSRRPLVIALLRPGSVGDAMHMRALLESMLPEVEARTAALRVEIARGRALQQQARLAEQGLLAEERNLADRRRTLAALETSQRLAARSVSDTADREAERALALAEQARDLGSLVTELDKTAGVRDQLALLPGPVMRPDRPAAAQVADATPTPEAASLAGYMLPVDGRLVSGFGDTAQGAPASHGIGIAARAGAQVVAPLAGRVAFAGPYPGFGQIIIIEHPGGWTSVLTGLAQIDPRVGDQLVTGAPLGIAGPGRPVLTLGLRRAGQPVNPLDYLGRR